MKALKRPHVLKDQIFVTDYPVVNMCHWTGNTLWQTLENAPQFEFLSSPTPGTTGVFFHA